MGGVPSDLSSNRSPAGGAASDLLEFARAFWRWRAVHQPISNDDVPRVSRAPGWAPDWSAATINACRRQLDSFEESWRALDDRTRPVGYQVDHHLLGSALARVRWELDVVRLWRRDPGFYVAQTVGSVVDALLPPPPFTAHSANGLLARVAAFPPTLEDARVNLDQATRSFARLAIDDLHGIGPRLRSALGAVGALLDEDTRKRLATEAERAVSSLESYRSWLISRLDVMSDQTAIGRDAYSFFLRKVALMPFTPEELLEMGRQEWARATAGEALAARRNRGLPELTLAADQAAQIARARRDEEAIRRFLVEKAVLTVPDWMPHYVYRPLPAYLEALAGFGEPTDFTSPERLGEEATRYIPAPARDLGYFPLSMALDARADIVHEAVPGHAFQMALSWRHPDEIRRHWYDSGANEGIGFYAEEMMLEMGLFDDSPRTREMLWSYMRLRALRVEVDVRLALGTFTVEEAAEYLRTAVPVDAATARAEAAAFAAAPGFAIGYQIGKLQIVRLLAETRRRQGDAFDLRAFHDFVWINGNVPIALQRWELLGERDEVDALDEGTGSAA
jgi:hypothetical protein